MGRIGRAAAVVATLLAGGAAATGTPPMPTIGLAMPNTRQARWTRDGADLARGFAARGYHTDLRNAGDDVLAQIDAIRAMIEAGDRAIVVAAISVTSLGGVLDEAARHHVVVVAYDRMIRDTRAVDYLIGFDNRAVGVAQARSLVEGLRAAGDAPPFTVELFGGSPDDGNSPAFYAGAMSVLSPLIAAGTIVVPSGETSLDDVATMRWSADVAHARLDNLLAAYYRGRALDGVLAMNDGIAGGVLTALAAAGYGTGGRRWPIVTGQDCDLAAVRAILAGRQYSSVFKNTRTLADAAVQVTVDLLAGRVPDGTVEPGIDNGARLVPARLLAPTSVDRANIRRVLVGSGFYAPAALD